MCISFMNDNMILKEFTLISILLVLPVVSMLNSFPLVVLPADKLRKLFVPRSGPIQTVLKSLLKAQASI